MRRATSVLLEHRRLLAAVCTALAVLLAISAVRRPADLVAVPVAARDLSSGQVLSAADVTEALLPADAVPRHVVAAPEVAGRRVGGPMRAGEPFTDARLLGAGPGDDLPDGRVVAAVRLADPSSAAGLRVGDQVDVLAVSSADGGPRASVVASGLTVAALPDPDDSGAATLSVRAPRRAALALARAGLEAELGVVVTAPPSP